VSDLSVLAPTALLLAVLALFLGIVLRLLRAGAKAAARDAAEIPFRTDDTRPSERDTR
jgi:cbb3-type cytochrome oxidase subunit 3